MEEVDSPSPLVNLSTLLFIQFQPSYKALFSYTLLSLPYIKFSSSVLFPISVLKTFKSFPSSKENKTWPTQNKTSSLIHIAFQPACFFSSHLHRHSSSEITHCHPYSPSYHTRSAPVKVCCDISVE